MDPMDGGDRTAQMRAGALALILLSFAIFAALEISGQPDLQSWWRQGAGQPHMVPAHSAPVSRYSKTAYWLQSTNGSTGNSSSQNSSTPPDQGSGGSANSSSPPQNNASLAGDNNSSGTDNVTSPPPDPPPTDDGSNSSGNTTSPPPPPPPPTNSSGSGNSSSGSTGGSGSGTSGSNSTSGSGTGSSGSGTGTNSSGSGTPGGNTGGSHGGSGTGSNTNSAPAPSSASSPPPSNDVIGGIIGSILGTSDSSKGGATGNNASGSNASAPSPAQNSNDQVVFIDAPPAAEVGQPIVVTVRTVDNHPVQGAHVLVFTPDGGKVVLAPTDANGQTSFTPQVAGSYTYSVDNMLSLGSGLTVVRARPGAPVNQSAPPAGNATQVQRSPFDLLFLSPLSISPLWQLVGLIILGAIAAVWLFARWLWPGNEPDEPDSLDV